MADQEKGTPAKAKKPSVFSRAGKWVRELKSEIRKIVWPSRKQTLNNTMVVLAAIVLVGIFIWVLDAIFNFGIQTLITSAAGSVS